MITKVVYELIGHINHNGRRCDSDCMYAEYDPESRGLGCALGLCTLVWDHEAQAWLRCDKCLEAEKRALTESQPKPELH